LVGKISAPIPDCTHFAISADLSAFALGQKDNVLLYRSKNIMTDPIKDSSLSIEKGPLKFIGFAYDQNTNNTGIYAATSTTILSFPNIQKEAKKRLAQSGQGAFKHFDVNQKGELYCVTDTNSILAFNLFDKINEWPYEEDKQVSFEIFFLSNLNHPRSLNVMDKITSLLLLESEEMKKLLDID